MEIKSSGQPVIKDWMPSEERSFRQNFHQTITAINNLRLLPIPITEYKVFDSGTCSVVALINPNTNPSIIKTAANGEDIHNEAVCLQHWSQVVKTPQVYSQHQPDNGLPAFIHMEYITDPRLSDLIENHQCTFQMAFEVGQSLAKIHCLSPPQLLNPDIVSFKRVSSRTQKRTHDLVDRKILKPQIIQKVDQGISYLQSLPWRDTVCHMDFLPYNLFYGKSGLTVFDPNIAVTSNLQDLSVAIFVSQVDNPNGGRSFSEAILDGYRSIIDVNMKSLEIFEIFTAIKKITNWAEKNHQEKVARAIKLLES